MPPHKQITATSEAPMPRDTLTMAQVLALIAATPPSIAMLTTALAPAQLRTSPTPDEWSANDVLAHLRACADVWGGYIATILVEDTPTLRAINPRTWIKRTDYPESAFQPALRAFTEQRAALLATLQALPEEGWARGALVTGGGSPRWTTVLDYGERMARHERAHVKQLRRIVDMLSG
jgi:hypothetical protein